MNLEEKKEEMLSKVTGAFIVTLLAYFASIVVQLYVVTINIQSLNLVGYFESGDAEYTLLESYTNSLFVPVGINTIFFIIYIIFYRKLKKSIQEDKFQVRSKIFICTLVSIGCAGLYGIIINASLLGLVDLDCNKLRYKFNQNKFNAPNVVKEIDTKGRVKTLFTFFTVAFIIYIALSLYAYYLGLWDLLLTLAVIALAGYNIRALYLKLKEGNVNVAINLLIASIALTFANATLFSFILILITYISLSAIYKMDTLKDLGFKPGYIPKTNF